MEMHLRPLLIPADLLLELWGRGMRITELICIGLVAVTPAVSTAGPIDTSLRPPPKIPTKVDRPKLRLGPCLIDKIILPTPPNAQRCDTIRLVGYKLDRDDCDYYIGWSAQSSDRQLLGAEIVSEGELTAFVPPGMAEGKHVISAVRHSDGAVLSSRELVIGHATPVLSGVSPASFFNDVSSVALTVDIREAEPVSVEFQFLANNPDLIDPNVITPSLSSLGQCFKGTLAISQMPWVFMPSQPPEIYVSNPRPEDPIEYQNPGNSFLWQNGQATVVQGSRRSHPIAAVIRNPFPTIQKITPRRPGVHEFIDIVYFGGWVPNPTIPPDKISVVFTSGSHEVSVTPNISYKGTLQFYVPPGPFDHMHLRATNLGGQLRVVDGPAVPYNVP